MKWKTKLALCLTLPVLYTNALTYTKLPDSREPSFNISPELGYYKYEEPNIMQIKGPLVGVTSETFIPMSYNLLFRLFLRGAYNFGDYTSNGTGSNDEDNSWLINIAPTLGYTIFINQSTIITPYAGFGYRYLNNDSSGTVTTTGHFGYLRESNYFYLPIGIDIQIQKDEWLYRALFEYDYLIRGQQYSHLPDSFGGTISNRQNNGYGINAKLEMAHQTSDSMRIGIGPYVRYWNISDSEVDKGFIEPKNTTFEAGGFISFTFI
ncbi:porin family protein [Thiotrichales bacterium 19S11-10]|nr:porin family protein [Thiotrichales bacterium 19S11-10]MCF6808165.1 porin family protein [Thiotrichales bacterium 19S9-11]MCF6812181.1 porin family protein [Thiotrichales bacterium 19S9-12]